MRAFQEFSSVARSWVSRITRSVWAQPVTSAGLAPVTGKVAGRKLNDALHRVEPANDERSKIFFEILVRALLLSLVAILWSGTSVAQTQVEYSAPSVATWSAGKGTSATPDGACQLAHEALNPNAPYSPPTYVKDNFYYCNWLAKQMGGPDNSNTILPGSASVTCVPGGVYIKFQNGQCIDMRSQAPICDCKSPNQAVSEGPVFKKGDPVDIGTGYQIEDETDYSSADGLFAVERRYASSNFRPTFNGYFTQPIGSFGESWNGLIPGKLFLQDSTMRNIHYFTGNGEVQDHYTAPADTSVWQFTTQQGSRARLSMVTVPAVTRTDYYAQPSVPDGPAEFRLDFPNGEYILFRRGDTVLTSRWAVPIEHGWASGYRIFYHYPDTGIYPDLIHDSFGREMALTWGEVPFSPYADTGNGQYRVLQQILLPDGTTLKYTYEHANWTLTAAFDQTGGTVAANPVIGRKDRLITTERKSSTGDTLWQRSYLYEDARWPYALTGIKDQAGNRLSTYTYDQAGYAASTERSGGVGKYQFRHYRLQTGSTIDESNIYREVINPLGRVETYHLWRVSALGPSTTIPMSLMSIDAVATANVPADSATWTYGGNSYTRPVSGMTDRRGTQTTFALDTTNLRPNSVTEAVGTPQQRATTITWHPTFDLPTREQRTGLTVDYTYSPGGQLLTRTETDATTQSIPYSTSGQSRTWTYTWDSNGRLLSMNGPKPVNALGQDDVTTFVYDAAGNLQTSTDALGHVTSFAGYDANGRPATMTDPNGIVTAFIYDPLGRTKTVTVRHPTDSALNATTTFDYDLENRVVGVTLPATDKLLIDYNLAGQLTAVRMASGERMDFQYDAMDDVTAQTVKRSDGSSARSVLHTFDELGRMLTETLGPGRTTNWEYDKNGNATLVTSARSNATQAAFDPLDRLVSTVAPDTGMTSLAYNAIDKVTSHTDPISVQTTFVRNGFGDIIQEVSPDRGTSTYYYNEAGEMTASIDGRGQRVDYTRDVLGRITQKLPVGHSSESITYTWDTAGVSGSYGIGKLASVADATGTTAFGYDRRGNVTIKRQTIGTTASADLAYDYDLADRIVRITYPSGRVVDYVRDGKGRVVEVRTKASATVPDWTELATSITYEPWGSMTGSQLGNGLAMANDWGNDGRLASKRLFNAGTSVNLSSLSYAYDSDDNIVAINDNVDATRSMQFGYDSVDRLSQSIAASGTLKRQDYLFDKNGNRTSAEYRAEGTDVTPVSTDTYAKSTGTNRLASITNSAGVRSISYDGRGNTTAETRPGSVSVSTTYDGYGRLLTYARTGEPEQANSYNGLFDRVAVTSYGETHHYVYGPDGRLMGEYAASAAEPVAETIWLSPDVANDNDPIGGDDGIGGYAPLAVITGSGATAAIYWVHGNHMGVPIVTTDASGAMATPPAHTMAGFPGQTKTLSDIYYNRYRDYDSSTGRYIQADPIGLAGGSNPYVYSRGNPLSFRDTSGLCFEDACIIEGAIVGAAVNLLIDYLLQRWEHPNCINKGELLQSAVLGAVLGGAGSAAVRYVGRAAGWAGSRFASKVTRITEAGTSDAASSTGAGPGLGLGNGPASGKHLADPIKNISKLARQMEQRGWTQVQIEEAVQLGEQFPAVNWMTGGPATRYVHPETGRSVIVDDTTGGIIHVGGNGFLYD